MLKCRLKRGVPSRKSVVFGPLTRVLRIVVVLGATLSPASGVEASASYELGVFTPFQIDRRSLESRLEAAFPDSRVTVFGRHRDFSRVVRDRSVDCVVAATPVLRQLDVNVQLRGSVQGEIAERLVLITADPQLDAHQLAEKTIGALDMFGRKATTAFVRRTVDSPSVNVRRVVHKDDLLTLLGLGMADAIVVPSRLIDPIRSVSELELRAIPLPAASMGLPAVALLTDKGQRCLSRIQRSSQNVARAFAMGGFQ